MKKEKMVTRTVMETVADVMTLNVETADVHILTYVIAGTFEDDKALLKNLRAQYETYDVKLVAVKEVSVREILYGMPESVFIANAQILPPRKVYDK